MKRLLFVYAVLLLFGLWGLSQTAMAEDPVYFADANLKAAVESELGISNPTPTDMLLLSTLDANMCGITDLTGIEYATNLTRLRARLQSPDQRHLSLIRADESDGAVV